MTHILYPNGRLRRRESIGEKVADAVVHAIGLLAGVIGISVLFVFIAGRGDVSTGLAVGVYALGILALFGFSAAYNLVPPSPLKWLLRRFDHSSIYLMIAGTYTPLLLQFTDKVWAWALGVIVWLGAVAGIVIKVGFPHRFDRLSIAAYVALGWVVVFAFWPLMQSVPMPSVILVAVGGLLYTAGILFYVWKSLKFQSAIWHGFVTLAAGCHFASIAICVG